MLKIDNIVYKTDDVLLCKKDLINYSRKFTHGYRFVKGKFYTIKLILNATYSFSDKGGFSDLHVYFYTKKELRKLKLKQLDENRR